MSGIDKFTVRVTAKSIRRRRIFLRTAVVVTLVSTTLLLISFSLATFVNKAGNFTVDVIKQGINQKISISDNKDFSNSTTYLQAGVIEQMDNITEEWIPKDIDMIDGSHNGEHYIAYTFYLKNTSQEDISYSADIDVLSVVKDADEAVRVKVFHNGEETLYAKRQKGTTEPEPSTTPFFSETKVMSQTFDNIEPDHVDKFTVVIWLEGKDPECVDNILGGEVKLAMRLKVINPNEVLV